MDQTIVNWLLAAALLPWGASPRLCWLWSSRQSAKSFGTRIRPTRLRLFSLGHGTPDHIDVLVTVAGGVTMLAWLTLVS